MVGVLLNNSIDGKNFVAQPEDYADFLKVQLPELKELLHRIFPYGHPDFVDMVLDECDLHSRKNHDYAKGGDPLGNFIRVSKILSLYPGLKLSEPEVVAIIYMFKQIDSSLWMLANNYGAKVEGHADRWKDISVYSKIISILIEAKGKEDKKI